MEKNTELIIIGDSGAGLSPALTLLRQKGLHVVSPEKFEVKRNSALLIADLLQLRAYEEKRYTPGKHRAGNNSKRPKPRKKKR